VLDSSSFDPELVLVAEDAGHTLVGEAWLQVTPEGGWVNVLGVRPGWRRRGIGRALLLSGFEALAGQGCELALLGVDAGNESGALRLYETAGMTVRREWHVFEKRLG
jgi:ribosomal protein S18 acetylase RimI-like enzyme